MRLIHTAALLAALSTPVFADEVTTWRLFVADHGAPQVTAIDLGTNATLGVFDLKGAASLFVTDSKAAVYAVQTDAGIVSAISTGIALEDHGDHGDIELAEPKLLDVALTGERPIHFVAHDGQIAVFFDGEGVARIVEESAFLADDFDAAEYRTAAPHHGVAAPFGDHVLISSPNPDDADALPVGIEVLTASGAPTGELKACPDLHGEASSGHILAIACAAGILFATESAGAPDIGFVPYAADLPEGKATTLLGGVGLQYWLGNYGADRVVLIDPSVDDAFRLVQLPTRRVHFAVDPQDVRFAYVFTEDGKLNQLDVIAGAITGSVQVTEPYSMDGEWNLPRPRIAVAGDVVAVTDPLKGLIHLIATDGLASAGEIALGGMPYNIVAVGASGETHD